MREIRPVKEEEAVSFLRMLCEIFGLDFSRARSIFFSEPFFDLTRKWALFEDREIVSILTTTPMLFGFGRAIGIAGVGTSQSKRSQGYAAELIEEVMKISVAEGEGAALLFAEDPRLYQRSGFEIVDRTVKVPLAAGIEPGETAPVSQVEAKYEVWSSGDPGRLRRDEQRWKYWKWGLRICWEMSDGYVCNEGDTVREVLTTAPQEQWPLLPNSFFHGLESMAVALGLPIPEDSRKSYLMARNFPARPQFFLTDQF